MTATICVRLDDLETTVQRLGDVAHRLGGATHRLKELGPGEAGDVNRALDGFADHWHHGMGLLTASVGALHTALASVHGAYTAHEHGLASQFQKEPS